MIQQLFVEYCRTEGAVPPVPGTAASTAGEESATPGPHPDTPPALPHPDLPPQEVEPRREAQHFPALSGVRPRHSLLNNEFLSEYIALIPRP